MTCIVLPISRRDYLRPVFQSLSNLIKPEDTELLILIDGDEALQMAVDKRLDTISYKRIQVVDFGEKPAETLDERRYRISAIHNKAKDFVDESSEYVLLLEDDTTYPPHTLMQMLDTMQTFEDCAFVEAVELSRHKPPYVGAWNTDDINDPTYFISAMPDEGGLEEIDGGGLYCGLTLASEYKQHHFEPYDKQGKHGLSCDLNYVLSLRKKGYKALLDWSLNCDHIGEKGSVNIGNTIPRQVLFTKNGDKWNVPETL